MLTLSDSKSVSSRLICDLNKFTKNKSSYCYLYMGASPEYILILNALKQCFIDTFPELKTYICCRRSLIKKLDTFDQDFILPLENTNLKNFGKVEEIKCDLLSKKHPLEDIVNLFNTKNFFKPQKQSKIKTVKICHTGLFPIKSLSEQELKFVDQLVKNRNVELTNNANEVDWVIGVENYETYFHASKGFKTTFINANFGNNLIKRLFENVEFLNTGHK